MGLPTITDDQREIAVILLANALRRDAHLQRRPMTGAGAEPAGPGGAARWRAEASRRYAQGMTDLLAILFQDGRSVADECLRAAEILAFGPRHD
jgi:hypothetical protein